MDINQLIKEGTFPRSYRICTQKSSLNPAIAYAINVLSEPKDDDRVLDPCCGSGTILIEHQLLKPVKVCIGVDIDPKALDCARKNIQAFLENNPHPTSPSREGGDGAKASSLFQRGRIEEGDKIQLKHGNIKDQNFPDGYFTKIISNLPYGIHSGSREENILLYRFLAQACEKWLKKGGKALFLTSAKKIFWNAFADIKSLKFISETQIKETGFSPTLFIFEKI